MDSRLARVAGMTNYNNIIFKKTIMQLETFKNFSDFELLDTGNGYRLERWDKYILQRPDPQIIWPKSLSENEWKKADAVFQSSGEKGRWQIITKVPKEWKINFQNVKLVAKLSPFKHTGIFAEQAANWEWVKGKLSVVSDKLSVLNLFGYTGGATMVLTKQGHFVTHVDASKPALAWAKENQKANGFSPSSVRWILDDAVKFVKRELKRGKTYDGIIMDPPAFGHSPTGGTWKFNQDLPGLLRDSVKLLSPNAKFLIINGYATNSSALSLNNLLEDAMREKNGKIEFGELCLKQKSQRIISTGIFARWSKN
jgi:23S rRNA (cytosine1962-C5)-methyltransferase